MKSLFIAVLLICVVPAWAGGDPTAPPQAAPAKRALPRAAAPVWQLQSVRQRGGEYVAYINGQRLSRGDRLGGYTLSRVDLRSAVLTRGNKRVHLELTRSKTRTAARGRGEQR